MKNGSVTSAELRKRAESAGVATYYRDWRDRRVPVGGDTLAAVLEVLEGSSGGPAGSAERRAEGGWRRTQGRGHPSLATPGPATSGAPPPPAGRTWGFTVQLYALRSRRSWAHGDLRDLADLAAWSARELGAGFVLINPLHAAEPSPPISPSPYLPMSRRFISPLYLRVEDIPEFGSLPAAEKARISALSAPLRARNATSDLIDRDAVWIAKRSALEIIHAHDPGPRRRAMFARFAVQRGESLRDWAAWCALAEHYGPDFRCWPGPLRACHSPHAMAERGRLAARMEFHAWLAWLADEQLAAAQDAARAAGMPIGVITDLAVGAHPGGADSWADADVLALGMSVGAPPDEFNQRGQDWGQPPWHPRLLAGAGYGPLADLMGAAYRHAGGLRADHVMGLFRLWWVPAGATPDQGTYVRYDHEMTTGLLTGHACARAALAVGEDLGTIEPWVHGYLAARGVLGTSMLWFERAEDGRPLPPGRWRRGCLATVGTHDVPPAAAFVTGEQLELRARLGLLTRPAAERAAAAAAMRAWEDALRAEGLLSSRATGQPKASAVTTALYGYLGRTPCALVGVSLADAVGDRRPQNLPGTTDEYPNWRVPLCDAEGRAVLLEEITGLPLVYSLARAVADPGRAVG